MKHEYEINAHNDQYFPTGPGFFPLRRSCRISHARPSTALRILPAFFETGYLCLGTYLPRGNLFVQSFQSIAKYRHVQRQQPFACLFRTMMRLGDYDSLPVDWFYVHVLEFPFCLRTPANDNVFRASSWITQSPTDAQRPDPRRTLLSLFTIFIPGKRHPAGPVCLHYGEM